MAQPAGTLRVGRYLLALLALFAVLYAIVFWPGNRHVPKLGLDLEGGTQVIFKAQTDNGKTPSKSAMTEAKQIMEDRVNGSGVANATVVIQGSDQIVVSIPGKNASGVDKLGQAAQLNFRPVVMPPVSDGATQPSTPTTPPTAGTTAPPTTGATHSPSPSTHSSAPATGHSGQVAGQHPLAAAPTTTPTSTPASTPKTTPTAAATATPAPAAKNPDPLKGLKFALPKTDTEFEKLSPADQAALQSAMQSFDCQAKTYTGANYKNDPVLACDSTSGLVYLLGPVIVPGTEISSAQAVPPGSTTGSYQWTVSLTLKGAGQSAWAKYTEAHHSNVGTIPSVTSCSTTSTPCAEYVAFTLDGFVISAPHNQDTINGQATQISGSFTQDSAQTLARQLKYGALPLNFKTDSIQEVTASLGTAQLKAGLLAGGIGLALVILYSLLYYRALGLVTIASLAVSGGLVWACLVILGREMGFTLTLSGIAGFIVAVGITADSFVVFFERIKDEVHSGRTMRTAIPRAWVRARRTILSADTVSFLAAAVLYYFAAGDVKGFAFTLGLSTILDLVVVFLFTHPMVSLLSRSAAFGSARFTGLNAVRAAGLASGDSHSEPAAAPRRARPGRSAAEPAPAADATAVAVLDKPDRESDSEPEIDVDAAAEREPDDRDQPAPAAETQPADDAEPAPRRAPEPGSAAERAAARRARLRAEQQKKGER